MFSIQCGIVIKGLNNERMQGKSDRRRQLPQYHNRRDVRDGGIYHLRLIAYYIELDQSSLIPSYHIRSIRLVTCEPVVPSRRNSKWKGEFISLILFFLAVDQIFSKTVSCINANASLCFQHSS